MPPSGVNDTGRGMMSALKRWFNRITGLDNAGALISTGGSAAAYTISYTNAPASLYTGLEASAKIHTDCSDGATLQVNALGSAATIQKMSSSGYIDIASGDLKQNQHAKFKWDGTLSKWILLTPTAPAGQSFTNPMTTRGDMIYRNATTAARLAVGAAETILKSDGTDPAWVDPRASAAEVRAGTSETKYLTPDKVFDAMAEVTLTDAATIAVDMSSGYDFVVTLSGNRTLGNPTNVKAGQKGRIRVVQDGAGGRTLAFEANYEFEDAAAPTMSTGSADEDILYYDCISSSRILITGFIGNIG